MPERAATSMEDVVGSKVLIQLHREAYEMLSIQGIENERFVARVTGLDGFGLWIENPDYCTVPVYDDEGAYIEPENRAEVCYRAVILLQWSYIQTIIQFPDRRTFTASVDESEIGFKHRMLNLPGGGLVTGPRQKIDAVTSGLLPQNGAADAQLKEKERG